MTLRKVLVILLVVVVVVTGIPLVVGPMAMGDCATCPSSDLAIGLMTCVAVLVLAGFAMNLLASSRLRSGAFLRRHLLLADLLDPPPRLA